MKYIHKYKKYAIQSKKLAQKKGLKARVTGRRGRWVTHINTK